MLEVRYGIAESTALSEIITTLILTSGSPFGTLELYVLTPLLEIVVISYLFMVVRLTNHEEAVRRDGQLPLSSKMPH